MNKNEKISDAIGNIDEKFIEEVNEKREKPVRKKNLKFRIIAGFTAAAAAIAAVSTGIWLNNRGEDIGTTDVPPTSEAVVTDAPVSSTPSSSSGSDPVIDTESIKNRVRRSNGVVDSIVPLVTMDKRIAADTGFRLNLKENVDISEDELRSRIKLTPETGFVLKRDTDGSFVLKTNVSLAEGSVVSLGVADEEGNVYDSWAFQTEETFRILNTYPSDKSGSAYTDSGIEIDFSMPVDDTDIEKYFEITPKVNGKFMTRGEMQSNYSSYRNTLFFIPETDSMTSNTVYTVTLKKGLKSTECGELADDYTFGFRTSQDMRGDYFFTYDGYSETFLEGDAACIEVQGSVKTYEFDTTLYKFASADDYFAALKNRVENEWTAGCSVDTSALTSVFQSKEVPIQNTTAWRPSFIMLPDDLTEGYYIADIVQGQLKEQYFIEVNPISVYALSLGEENVFFINDTTTGTAASGASVTLTVNGKTFTGKTDAQGLVNIKTGGEKGTAVIDVQYGSHRFIDRMSLSDAEDMGYADKFYTYIYTDREMYLTSDTVNVWGVILPKKSGAVLPKELYVSLGEYYYSDQNDATAGQVNRITVNPDGSFSTSFTYKDHRESWWTSVKLTDGETVITSKTITIKDYVKPTYVIDTTAPDYAIFPQEQAVPVSIDATFFEGTPADGLSFDVSASKYDPSTVTTDATGHAEVNIYAGDWASWELGSFNTSYTLKGVENEYTQVYTNIPSFWRDVMLETDYDKSSHTITFRTNNMDFTRMDEFLNSAGGEGYDDWYYYYAHDYSILKGAPSDTDITVKITHSWSEKKEEGSHYDFLEKRTVKDYKWIYHDDEVGTFTVNTKNGVGTLTNSAFASDKGHFYAEISYKDSKGREVNDSLYFYNSTYEYFNWRNTGRYNYYLVPDNDHYKGESGDDFSPVYGYDPAAYSYLATFKENDTLHFSLDCNMDGGIKENCRLLFAVSQDDFLSFRTYSGTGFDYSPSLSCIPNAEYAGAYFDGRHIYPISGGTMYFVPDEREIELTVSTDKDTYDAGQTVKLTVTAKDKKGSPVNGATVMLSVVDEAAFAVAEQNVNMLSSVYEYVYYYHPTCYFSYIQHVLTNERMGEKGGGDGSPDARKDFRDTAYFDSVKTNASGTAVIEFKLPDNLTTWRATVLSFKELETGRVLSGSTKSPVVSTRPLFITPVMLSEFIDGDDIAVSAKCHGIDPEDNITVTISDSEKELKTLTIHPCETANFGKLSKGGYKVLFKAEKGGNSDAVEMPLTVVDTLLETDIRRTFMLEDGIDINPTKWPIDLTFFNKEYMFCTDILYAFLWQNSSRLDMSMVYDYALIELGWGDAEKFNKAYRSYTESGLARVLPAAESDPVLTAMICAAFPDAVDRNAVITALEETVNSGEDAEAAYMGLAALGQPVLNEIKEYAQNVNFDSLNLYKRLYIADALALCGDYGSAYDIYVKAVPEITVNDTDPDNVYAYVNTSTDRDNATSAALMTAAILKLPEADALARNVLSSYKMTARYGTSSESYAFELVMYLKNFVPKLGDNAVFTYELNGSTKTVTLDKHHGYHMQFGEEQWKNANIKVTSGSIYSLAHYIGRITENSEKPSCKVTKTVTGEFSIGGTVTVTISGPAYSTVYDVIPSCGRYIESDNWVYRSGQRVELWTGKSGTASYQFRINTEGEFVLEGAVVDKYDRSWGQSERTTIKIGGKDET